MVIHKPNEGNELGHTLSRTSVVHFDVEAPNFLALQYFSAYPGETPNYHILGGNKDQQTEPNHIELLLISRSLCRNDAQQR